MSRTDKTRPEWVKLNDSLVETEVHHGHEVYWLEECAYPGEEHRYSCQREVDRSTCVRVFPDWSSEFERPGARRHARPSPHGPDRARVRAVGRRMAFEWEAVRRDCLRGRISAGEADLCAWSLDLPEPQQRQFWFDD